MSENKQQRKILVSQATYEKISDTLKENLVKEGFEIEVVPNEEFKARIKNQKDIYVFKDEENIEKEVFEFKLPPNYACSDMVFQTKKQKMYVPRTIGKPINKKKGGR